MRIFRMTLSFVALLGGVACKGASEPEGPKLTHPTGDRIASLPLTGRPHGVAVAANGTFYVSQIDADRITRGAVTDSMQVFAGTVTVGSMPAHVALDPRAGAAYTTNQFGNSVSVVDAVANSLAGTIPLSSGGFNLLVSPDGSRVWATTAGGTLHVIDAATRQLVGSVSVGAAANGLAYDVRSKTLYVSSISSATITAIDAVGNGVKRTYPVGEMPQRLALSPDGAELYIASEAHGLQVLTLATGVVANVSVVPPGAVGLALSPDGVHLYITNPPAGQVYVVDRATRHLVRVHGGMVRPRNVAFNAEGTTAIVTDEGNLVHFIR